MSPTLVPTPKMVKIEVANDLHIEVPHQHEDVG